MCICIHSCVCAHTYKHNVIIYYIILNSPTCNFYLAIPDTVMLFPNPRPTYAIMGKQVQLNCTIPPGRLIQQYYVTWDRSGRTIYQTRHNNPPLRLSNRYSVNPSDLSLIIDDVQFEDASDEYHCVYTVVDPNPNTMLSYAYTTMQLRDIQLVVLGK